MVKRNYRPLQLEDVTEKKGRFDEEEEDIIPDMSELEDNGEEDFASMAQEDEEGEEELSVQSGDDTDEQFANIDKTLAQATGEDGQVVEEEFEEFSKSTFDPDAMSAAIAQVIFEQKQKSEAAQQRIVERNKESRKASAAMRISGE